MRRRRRALQTLDRDIRDHIERETQEHIERGLSPEEARHAALRKIGSVTLAVEDARAVWIPVWLQQLRQDAHYAFRMLRRSPGFAAAAILSLALGIGANTAVFTLINAVMLRALPVAAPDRLVQITRMAPNGRPASVSYLLFEHFRDRVTSISGAFVQGTSEQAIVIGGDEDFVKADLVSGEYFSVLGLQASLGRLLTPADDVLAPASAAAVISDGYWQRRFGRSPAAIGTTFSIRDRPFTIVGVTPPSYQGARVGLASDVTLPLLMMLSGTQRTEPTNNWLNMLARLKPGATVAQANAEVQVAWHAFLQPLAAQAPERMRAEILRQRASAFAAPDGVNPFRYQYTQALLILMGIVGLVLLLACVNLSGLLLARAAARQREISIRLAIGAGRGRLLRQFLTESLVLATLGGAAGLVLAHQFSTGLAAMFANGSDLTLSVTPDWRVLTFTALVSLAACIVAGLAPALQGVRAAVHPALKAVRASGHGRLSQALIVAQLAISMVLIVGATLFLGTLVKLYRVDRGFNSDGVLVIGVRSSRPYPPERGLAVQRALVEALRTLPGVRSASAAQVLPIGGGLWNRSIQVEGQTLGPNEADGIGFNVIGPAYFATLGTPLLSGREFDTRDAEDAPRVAIVNESFARHFFGDRPALGRRVTSVNVTYEIVGVVRDAKYQSLRQEILKTMYIPWMQREGDQPTRYSYLARAASGDPMRLVPGVERLVRDVDPALRVRSTLTYATLVDRSIVTERIMATLGGFFGALALIVAALGLFGVLAFQVARRTNELGVRMALGATRWSIAGVIVRDVIAMVVVGVAIGAGAALMLTGLARNILFGLTPTDPSVFAIAAATLTAVAALAAWLPARRAASVDPLVALRHE